MLQILLFIIMFLKNCEHRILRLKTLKYNFMRSKKVCFLYILRISDFWVLLEKASANNPALKIAPLIPSKELELINPAASPNRYTFSLPQQKSENFRGSHMTGKD